jgi:hypothetical protein
MRLRHGVSIVAISGEMLCEGMIGLIKDVACVERLGHRLNYHRPAALGLDRVPAANLNLSIRTGRYLWSPSLKGTLRTCYLLIALPEVR